MKAIAYPFSIDDYGRIYMTTDPKKIWLDRVLTLLSSVVGQRPMRPTYGTNLPVAIYESGGDYTLGMKTSITNAIRTWLPSVSVRDVTIGLPGEDGIANVTVSVTLPDLSEGTVTVSTSYLNPDGTAH